MLTNWRSFLWFGFAVVFAGAHVGCKSLFAPHGIPNDPMILSRQPIESKGQVTPFEPFAEREPKLPGK